MKVARLGIVATVGALALTALTPALAGGDVCWNYSARDRKMARKINGARSSNDLGKLRLDPQLSKVARSHTRFMASKDNLFHTNNLGDKVTNWNSLGENVGYGYSVKTLHKMFMKSDGHRANILKGKYRYFGIGTTKSGGWTWTTVVFESKKDPGTTMNMPSC